jgi:hypothetical protein
VTGDNREAGPRRSSADEGDPEKLIREYLKRAGEHSEFARAVAQKERERSRRQAVNAAVRERAASLSRDEQLEILIAELQDNELDVPPRPIIDVMLDLMFHSDAEERQRVSDKAKEVATGFVRGLLDPSDIPNGRIMDPKPEQTFKKTARGAPGAGKHSKGRNQNRRRGTGGGIPMKHDHTRTTEIVLDEDAVSLVRAHQDPPIGDHLRDLPFVGAMLQLSELRPKSLTPVEVRIRPTKEEGLLVLFAGRRVGVVGQDAAPEFISHLRGKHRDAGRDGVRGLRYVDPHGSVGLWLYFPAPVPGDAAWEKLPLKDRIQTERDCLLCGLKVDGKAVKRVLTQQDGLVRSNSKVSIHEDCLPEATERATLEGRILVDPLPQS